MIDTKAIRAKVLDLAFKGMLTDQRPEDGTGQEFYLQIQKDIANQKKKARGKKQSSQSDPKPLYDIPKNWIWVHFSYLFNLTNGTASRGSNGGIDVPVLRLADLTDSGIETNNIRLLKLSESDYKTHLLTKDDLIIIRVNGSKDKVGKAFRYTGEKEISYCDHLFCGHRFSGFILPDFIVLALRQSDIRKQITPLIKATAGQNTINQAGLGKIAIPFPPFAEQQRIVSQVSSIMSVLDTIDNMQSMYSRNVEILRAKLIEAGLRGKLTEQLQEDGTSEELYQQIQKEKQGLVKTKKIKKERPLPPIDAKDMLFSIPSSWKWVRLGDVISLLSGTDLPSDGYNDAGDGLPYMTGASNIVDGHLIINRWTPSPKNIAHEGELLLVCKGSGFGKTVICNVPETHIARQFMSVRPLSGVDVRYIDFFLFFSIRKIRDAGKGLIPGIDRETILKMPMPLPPKPEQERIVAQIDSILDFL